MSPADSPNPVPGLYRGASSNRLVIGFWYLIVTVMVLRSLPWARQRAEVLWPRV